MTNFLMLAVFALMSFSGCARSLRQSEAEQIATERFNTVCKNHGIEASVFSGPTETEVGGAYFAFQWTRSGAEAQAIIVTVDRLGVTEVGFAEPVR